MCRNQLALLIVCLMLATPAHAKKKQQEQQDSVGFADRGSEVSGASAWFTTPSGNITCINADKVDQKGAIICYRESPTRAVFHLAPHGDAQALDDIGEPGCCSMTDPRLTYGTWTTTGDIACLSEKNGLTCKNRDDHGFFLSKTEQRTF